jgi:hypothetical protein
MSSLSYTMQQRPGSPFGQSPRIMPRAGSPFGPPPRIMQRPRSPFSPSSHTMQYPQTPPGIVQFSERPHSPYERSTRSHSGSSRPSTPTNSPQSPTVRFSANAFLVKINGTLFDSKNDSREKKHQAIRNLMDTCEKTISLHDHTLLYRECAQKLMGTPKHRREYADIIVEYIQKTIDRYSLNSLTSNRAPNLQQLKELLLNEKKYVSDSSETSESEEVGIKWKHSSDRTPWSDLIDTMVKEKLITESSWIKDRSNFLKSNQVNKKEYDHFLARKRAFYQAERVLRQKYGISIQNTQPKYRSNHPEPSPCDYSKAYSGQSIYAFPTEADEIDDAGEKLYLFLTQV